MKEIAVGCFQFEVSVAEPEESLAKVEKALPFFAEAGCRLLVLPEMWSCGFSYPRLGEMAERSPEILDTLCGLARRYETVLVGSLPESEGEAIFNTSYAVDATGEIAGTYRKIHLFSPNREDRYFGHGTGTMVCSTTIGRLGLMICYDLRFPELARKLALDGAEILCISALWPMVRIDHWSLLLRSRALENQLFAVSCNGCGTDGRLTYGGSSAIVSPTGEVLAQGGVEQECVVAKGLNPKDIEAFRKSIPCFADRMPETY